MNEQNILRIDIDKPIDDWGWLPDYTRTVNAVLSAFNLKVKKIITRKSPSGKGLHVWIHLNKPVTDMDRVKLQFLCLDDPGRTWINRLRVLYRSNPNWNKLFTEAKAMANLDPQCLKCRLRNALQKMLEEENSRAVPNQNQP